MESERWRSGSNDDFSMLEWRERNLHKLYSLRNGVGMQQKIVMKHINESSEHVSGVVILCVKPDIVRWMQLAALACFLVGLFLTWYGVCKPGEGVLCSHD